MKVLLGTTHRTWVCLTDSGQVNTVTYSSSFMCFASWQARYQEGNVKKKIPGNQDLENADVSSGRLLWANFWTGIVTVSSKNLSLSLPSPREAAVGKQQGPKTLN